VKFRQGSARRRDDHPGGKKTGVVVKDRENTITVTPGELRSEDEHVGDELVQLIQALQAIARGLDPVTPGGQ